MMRAPHPIKQSVFSPRRSRFSGGWQRRHVIGRVIVMRAVKDEDALL